MSIDDHATRVSMMAAVGGAEMTLDGRVIFGILNDDYQRVDFGDRVVAGRDLFAEVSFADVQDARRGSVLEASGRMFYVEEVQPFDAGQARLILSARD